jgi:hypothetical protein
MARPLASAGVDGNVGGIGGDVDLSVKTPHGSAMWLAVGAFVVLAFIIGRGRGLLGAAFAAVGFVALIALANMVYGYALNSWTVIHADHPTAQGASFNMTGL